MQARQLVRNIQNNSGGLDKRQKDKVAQWSELIEQANDILNSKRNEYWGSAPTNYGQNSSDNNQGGFDDNDLQVLSVQNNEAMMKKRKEDLIAIKQAANQVKDLTEED